jgi:hypothetical protein
MSVNVQEAALACERGPARRSNVTHPSQGPEGAPDRAIGVPVSVETSLVAELGRKPLLPG